MSRKLIVTIHLYLAAFFTPVLLITAISGGLYLLGIKGNQESQVIYQGPSDTFNIQAEDINSQVNDFLTQNQLTQDYDYLLKRGNRIITRPTSKEYLVFQVKEQDLTVTRHTPDFVLKIVELHKGHGPSMFKTLQKFMALGIIFILLSGFYLGISSPKLRTNTLVISSTGTLLFLALVLF